MYANNQLPDKWDQAYLKCDRILAALGVDLALLDGTHHACPYCGGKDRFRFVDKTGHDDWVCSGHGFRPGAKCGSGKGLFLAMDCFRLSFIEAVGRVRQILGAELPELPEITRHRDSVRKDPAETLAWVNWMLNSSDEIVDGDPVTQYLRNRGISIPIPKVIRYKSALNFCKKDRKIPTPAMIAPFTDVNEQVVAAHRTYIMANGLDKAYGSESEQFAGPPSGAAIKLYPPVNGFIALTEGIETALAVRELTGWPVWATGSTAFMESIILPDDITQVVIMADNDPIDPMRGICPGLHSAQVLGGRLRDQENRKVQIRMPSTQGWDWLDVLNDQEGNNYK